MRILVIEDNRDILANVLDYLQLKGFNVDCAQDGLSGLHLASINRYDIIVLDIMLPGIDGYQICQRLREDGHNEVPILMLTARDSLDDRPQTVGHSDAEKSSGRHARSARRSAVGRQLPGQRQSTQPRPPIAPGARQTFRTTVITYHPWRRLPFGAIVRCILNNHFNGASSPPSC